MKLKIEIHKKDKILLEMFKEELGENIEIKYTTRNSVKIDISDEKLYKN